MRFCSQLAKDPKTLKEKAAELWAELSKDEPENQKRPENLEELTIMVTRELARRVVHLVNFSKAGIYTLPQTISHTLHHAAEYCTQLADSLVKVTSTYYKSDAFPALIINDRTKNRVVRITTPWPSSGTQ